MHQKIENECNLKLSIFADASHANLSDGGSHLAHLVMLVEDDGKCLFLNWQSKQIKQVVKGTLSAKNIALSDAFNDEINISEIVAKLFASETKSLPNTSYADSKLYGKIK